MPKQWATKNSNGAQALFNRFAMGRAKDIIVKGDTGKDCK